MSGDLMYWAPLVDYRVTKKDFASLALRLNDALACAGERRGLVLTHMPRHLFEDVGVKCDPDVAFEMLIKAARKHGFDSLLDALSTTIVMDMLSPFQPERREEAREEVNRLAREVENDAAATPVSRVLFQGVVAPQTNNEANTQVNSATTTQVNTAPTTQVNTAPTTQVNTEPTTQLNPTQPTQQTQPAQPTQSRKYSGKCSGIKRSGRALLTRPCLLSLR